MKFIKPKTPASMTLADKVLSKYRRMDKTYRQLFIACLLILILMIIFARLEDKQRLEQRDYWTDDDKGIEEMRLHDEQNNKDMIERLEAKAEANRLLAMNEVKTPVIAEYEEITANVSAYNTVPSQTDIDSCMAAGGYICGRTDVVANNCLPFNTKVEINGKIYTVLDRMNSRYGCNAFDISFDKDIQAALNWGRRNVKVKIIS